MRPLWRQRPPFQCLLYSHGPLCYARWSSNSARHPLHILFCGSDDFSVTSLKALHKELVERPDTIASINVVCRPGKRTGRGFKDIREVPIKKVAKDLALPVHEIDTFTGWSLPSRDGVAINLIIAVSFGLFVPSRLLNIAGYGGLNVHPSLLPDFRGPAPLHHTLLAGRSKTGITLQTLHPTSFDHGIILAQTPYPGFDIPEPETCTVQELRSLVAPKGAEMLVQGLRDRVFIPPLMEVGWWSNAQLRGRIPEIKHAPKITPRDRHIDWFSFTANEILRRQRVLGPLWNMATSPDSKKRVIMTLSRHPVSGYAPIREIGLPFLWSSSNTERPFLVVRTKDLLLLRVVEMTVEGERNTEAVKAATRAKLLREAGGESVTFHEVLM
ncbi:MAG: Methionyl-tRNA formyltransferase [Trichoglossum hirsutum]|nr:MAG: Methionyl-tRNA formyltransferase [Trichoglossum hirsutum]